MLIQRLKRKLTRVRYIDNPVDPCLQYHNKALALVIDVTNGLKLRESRRNRNHNSKLLK